MNAVHFSSTSHEWETPQRFFNAIDDEFGFTLDACATSDNAKCPRYFTPSDDALSKPWSGVVWMNPPYGHRIGRWVRKAYEAAQGGAIVVALIPAKTETRWWHEWVMKAAEIRLIRGRMRFSGSTINAPFPSALVVFTPGLHVPAFSAIDRLLDATPTGPCEEE